MTNQKLTAFIRERLSAGAPRAAIRQSLLSNGWSDRDIAEAFAAATPRSAAARLDEPHPLAGRKLTISLGFVIISTIYALWQHLGGPSTNQQTSSITISPGQSYQAANNALLQTLSQITGSSSAPAAPTAPAQSQSQPSAPAAVPVAAPKKSGMYADGSYTGSSADAYWGTVQVKAIVRNGQLADVQFLQYPNGHSTSVYINQQAMPLLTQEAIQAQSANINGVSGATFTSQAFQQSLVSALTQAKG